nr:unnamed protein product [Digitaria exilis]
MRASSSANKVEVARIVHHQQQEDARGEEEIAAEGLLLLPPQLQMLNICGCRELSLQPNDKETGWGREGLQGLRSLRSLEIRFNPKFFSSFSSFPPSCFPFPSSLQELTFSNKEGMETPVPLSNLTSLTHLTIVECEELRFQGLGPLLKQGHLTRLCFYKTPNLLFGFDACRSSKLQELCTDDAARVFTGPICSLLSSSLTSLSLVLDGRVEIFTEEQEEVLQLLTSLQHLVFNGCKRLQQLPAGLNRLANLKTLQIANCDAIQSLPKDGLPSSLQELHMSSCRAIQSLPKEWLPSSLQELRIFWCPALRSLPKVEFLQSSLRELQVYNSDSNELRKQCRKLRGTIPIVYA